MLNIYSKLKIKILLLNGKDGNKRNKREKIFERSIFVKRRGKLTVFIAEIA